jgi:hypothetical protein
MKGSPNFESMAHAARLVCQAASLPADTVAIPGD